MCKHPFRLAAGLKSGAPIPLGLAAALLLGGLSRGLTADDARAPRWLTGQDLARHRQQPVSATWSGTALRDALADLAKTQRIAVLLDRRIDPGQAIDLTVDRLPFDTAVERVAEKVAAGATWLGPLAYLGPPEAAARLRTLAALRASEARALAKEQRSALQRDARLSWEELAEPRRLVADLAAEAGIEIEPLDRIGHDLWPATDLPALSWTDRLTLIGNEFDLTFEIVDAGHVRLAPIAGPVVIERTYPGGKQPDELAAKWRRVAPDAQIEVAAGKLVVRGRVEDHELLGPTKKPKPAPTVPRGEVYTLRVQEQPLSAVLDTLRKRVSREFIIDEAAIKKANLSLDARVSFSVEQATLDELLAAALKPAKLTFVREGSAYKIVPASK
jgi:hypothetical protein